MSFESIRIKLQAADERSAFEGGILYEAKECADDSVATALSLDNVLEAVTATLFVLRQDDGELQGMRQEALGLAKGARGIVTAAAEGAVNNTAVTGLRGRISAHVTALSNFETGLDPLIEDALAAAATLEEKIQAVRAGFLQAGTVFEDLESDVRGIRQDNETAQGSL